MAAVALAEPRAHLCTTPLLLLILATREGRKEVVALTHTHDTTTQNDNDTVCRARGGNANSLALQAALPDEVGEALQPDGILAGMRELRAEGVTAQVSLGMNANREVSRAQLPPPTPPPAAARTRRVLRRAHVACGGQGLGSSWG